MCTRVFASTWTTSARLRGHIWVAFSYRYVFRMCTYTCNIEYVRIRDLSYRVHTFVYVYVYTWTQKQWTLTCIHTYVYFLRNTLLFVGLCIWLEYAFMYIRAIEPMECYVHTHAYAQTCLNSCTHTGVHIVVKYTHERAISTSICLYIYMFIISKYNRWV